MKKLLATSALVLAGFSVNAQAIDLGFQGGLSGSFAFIGDFHLDKKSSIRGFYNSRTILGSGVSSLGAAYEYDFKPNIYAGLGAQLISLTAPATGWTAGIASYVAVGYKDKLSDDMDWHGEFNSFHGLVVGLTYRF